jgi:hypothetical protein
MMLLVVWMVLAIALVIAQDAFAAPKPPANRHGLDPRGRIHIPIGIPNTLDTLKTFVEAEGCFSPGFGSYGIYFWVYDPRQAKLHAPTLADAKSARGLHPEGYLIPWTQWQAGPFGVRTSVCQVRRSSPAGDVHVVGARVELTNPTAEDRQVLLYTVLRPLGPAGFAVNSMEVGGGDAILVDGRTAIVANDRPAALGVHETHDMPIVHAQKGQEPVQRRAKSDTGDCSGDLLHKLSIAPGKTVTLGFVCPVLPGRRAVGHQWDGTSPWAQLDLNNPNAPEGGELQPDPGLDYYRAIKADGLFAEAEAYWAKLLGSVRLWLPDPRWAQALVAIAGHAAMSMNQGAPDVAVINYNVFNRDGVYVANILQKTGRLDLAEQAIDYFLSHPFNGRVQCEADNPGQVLWIMGQHWLFGRDRKWLDRVHPSAAKLAAMIRYYRTAPPPHYVKARSLEVGDHLPPDQASDTPADRKQVLKPGACDGDHPEYTEAFDIAGLRAAVVLAKAAGRDEDAAAWARLADELMAAYDQRFGVRLAAGYGSYSVLWPCGLYPLGWGKGLDQFKSTGAQGPAGWRYFPLATAHQGLLAGNRAAGHGTLQQHLAHEQMEGWYAFDEGGRSGPGNWSKVRTHWPAGCAMPHGWAIAELHLLLRDCLAHEDGDALVLLAGVSEAWFGAKEGIRIDNLPTWFGPLGLVCAPGGGCVVLELNGRASPPGGFVVKFPASLEGRCTVDGREVTRRDDGSVHVPAGARRVTLR